MVRKERERFWSLLEWQVISFSELEINDKKCAIYGVASKTIIMDVHIEICLLVAYVWIFLCIYLTYYLTVVHICCFLRKNACLTELWVDWQLRSILEENWSWLIFFCEYSTCNCFKFEDDTNCDGEFDYAIMFLYINWYVDVCIHI